MHFSYHEREKKEKTKTIDHRRQSNHYLFIRAMPCERGHNCASSEMADGQIWPPENCHTHLLNSMSVTHLLGEKKKAKETFAKR